ncbi:DUF1763-domain-containing protein [Lentithecium fluviatile CBS 122367]|uniref:DUF1763-domain-containing protein n=1 Tax=Lentithecium fluviatile CBS 122367 TaxID=1168545 RepID=A0A6G1IVK6_9PLEO|nr:DUF1763-domain-containing protein [Lentithecium fluviatile CBS 122367]
MSSQQILHAYRALLRSSLHAVQFAKPARYTLASRLRLAFTKNPPSAYNAQKINNTLEFLGYAQRQNGLEHKIVKNLLLLWWKQEKGGFGKPNFRPLSNDEVKIRTTAYDAFNYNIEMLNESMDMCLPAMTVRDPC